jgi:hypothetical protein
MMPWPEGPGPAASFSLGTMPPGKAAAGQLHWVVGRERIPKSRPRLATVWPSTAPSLPSWRDGSGGGFLGIFAAAGVSYFLSTRREICESVRESGCHAHARVSMSCRGPSMATQAWPWHPNLADFGISGAEFPDSLRYVGPLKRIRPDSVASILGRSQHAHS